MPAEPAVIDHTVARAVIVMDRYTGIDDEVVVNIEFASPAKLEPALRDIDQNVAVRRLAGLRVVKIDAVWLKLPGADVVNRVVPQHIAVSGQITPAVNRPGVAGLLDHIIDAVIFHQMVIAAVGDGHVRRFVNFVV